MEPTETVQGVKAQLSEIVGQSPADIRLFGSDKVRVSAGEGREEGKERQATTAAMLHAQVWHIFIISLSATSHYLSHFLSIQTRDMPDSALLSEQQDINKSDSILYMVFRNAGKQL